MDNGSIRVLLVDDDEDDCLLTRELLSEIENSSFDLEWVTTYDAALEAMGRTEHDVYLFDYQLGEHSGLELLREVAGKAHRVPVIMLTGQGNREVDLEGMKAGAVGYLSKGELSASSLERAIRYAIERQKLEKMKDRFISSVTHDLQTPLTALQGYSGLLLEGAYGDLSKVQHESIQAIARVTQGMISLVNALLDLSRAKVGKFVLSPEPLDFKDLVNEVLEEVRPLALAKGLTLLKEFNQESIPMKSDRRSLRQILFNLVGNAIKFTDLGSVKVSVNSVAGSLGSPGGMVGIRVEDTGCGIEASHLGKIFDEFYQVDQSGENTTPGTGLGLATCKRLVGLLVGEMTVESEPGRGTTFSVTLPQDSASVTDKSEITRVEPHLV